MAKAQYPPKPCLNCGFRFTRTRADQKFHNEACRKEFRRKKNNHQGIKLAWQDLPARRCGNCPKTFKPVRPEQKFCGEQCRNEYKRHGGAFVKLRALMVEEIARRIRLEERCAICKGTGEIKDLKRREIVACEKCLNGKLLTQFGRDVLALVTAHMPIFSRHVGQ